MIAVIGAVVLSKNDNEVAKNMKNLKNQQITPIKKPNIYK